MYLTFNTETRGIDDDIRRQMTTAAEIIKKYCIAAYATPMSEAGSPVQMIQFSAKDMIDLSTITDRVYQSLAMKPTLIEIYQQVLSRRFKR